ncbi:hypothetical protein E2C01_089838 [Portunus trituberculatus]|uniref:Uncharacterized protein n=1 Tax=Portunus trituberculatus TaxID=210409 RepID=A0A5B7JD43_PORTR|nr:hypothetical protein [Portunus trituberculatus]
MVKGSVVLRQYRTTAGCRQKITFQSINQPHNFRGKTRTPRTSLSGANVRLRTRSPRQGKLGQGRKTDIQSHTYPKTPQSTTTTSCQAILHPVDN